MVYQFSLWYDLYDLSPMDETQEDDHHFISKASLLIYEGGTHCTVYIGCCEWIWEDIKSQPASQPSEYPSTIKHLFYKSQSAQNRTVTGK